MTDRQVGGLGLLVEYTGAGEIQVGGAGALAEYTGAGEIQVGSVGALVDYDVLPTQSRVGAIGVTTDLLLTPTVFHRVGAIGVMVDLVVVPPGAIPSVLSGGVAAASGSISKGVLGGNITGSAAGVAAAAATIIKGAAGALLGASAGSASTTGTIAHKRSLSGLSAGSTTVSAALTRQPRTQDLTGAAVGRATAAGHVSLRGRLTGLSAGVATTNRASFSRRLGLYYYGGGKATTTGALSVTRGSSTGSGSGNAPVVVPPPPGGGTSGSGVSSPPVGTLKELSQATIHAPVAVLTIGGETLTLLAGDDDPDFLQATVTYGRTLGSSVMSVTLAGDLSGTPESYVGQPVMMEAGWAGGIPSTLIIFTGVVVQDDVSNYFPYRRSLRCHGPSHRLSRRLKKAMSFNSDGLTPWTDTSIIRRLAQAQGINEANIGTLDGLGDEHPLFKYHELRLAAGANSQGVWQTLDQIGGFWTYDIPSSPPQFIRTRWNPTPAATPVMTISEGSSNVRSIRLSRNPDSRVAALTVMGFQIGGWRPYASRVDHTAPTDQQFGDTFNTDYIETEALADLAVDVGMRERNSDHAVVSIDVPGNPYLFPGVTFAVHSVHAGIPVPTNFLCSEITHTITARSWRTSASGLLGGASGPTGDNMHRPAIAIIDTKVARQTVIRDGEPVMIYAINADGRSSRDVRGYLEEGELSLSFAWSNNKHGTEGNPSVVEPIYHEEFSVEEWGPLEGIVPRNRPRVYLTLTDRDGNVAESEQTVDGLTTIRGIQERELYAVKGGDGWCTPNGGGVQRTMNFGSGVSALCVPPITGPEWGWFGLDNGMLAFTRDYLLTWVNRGPEGSGGAFLDAAFLPDPVTSLWVHERDPYRITVGTNSGRIWTSPDAGRTWALAYQAEDPTPITMVTESYVTMGQVFWAEGDVVRYSDNLFRQPYAGVVDYIGYDGVVAGLTLSFIDHYAFGSNGLKRQRDEITISLPGSTSTHVFAFHGLNDGLWVCDRDGHSWALTEGQDEAEARTDVAGEGDIRWVMRDGTLPLECYVARASGLYKSWTGMRSWELVASGDFSMVGYGGAAEKGNISGSSNVPPPPPAGEAGAPGRPTVFVGSSDATVQFRVLEGESFEDGWESAGYDDGAWNPSVRATVDEDQVYPYECYPIWTTAAPEHDYEEVAFRVHFTIDEIPNAEPIFQVIADDILAEVYINGMPIVPPGEYTFDNEVWTMAFSPDMLVIGDNVLALRAVQVAPTAAMAAFLLTVSYYR